MNAIRDFLESQVYMIKHVAKVGQVTMAEFMLKHGVDFEWQELPSPFRYGQVKHCFENSMNLAIRHPELIYCEGYGAGIIPTHHAFCVTVEGEVIDATWTPDLMRGTKEFIGVPIKTSFVREMAVKRGYYGVLDDWQNKWPVVTGEIPVDEWWDARIPRSC